MPELPEVETTLRGIEPHVAGETCSTAIVRNPALRRPVPADLPALLAGRRLEGLSRRAKYLLFDFGAGGLIVHLGMSGSLRVTAAAEPPGAHDHVDLVFGAQALRLRDPRRFGLVLWHEGDAAAHPLLAGLGPEPLGDTFSAAWLFRASRGLRTTVRQMLMDGRRVAGIGNIYAAESLFRARVHPLQPAGRLNPLQCERVVSAVRETLEEAIAAGGSTLRDFVGGDGRKGYFQLRYAVYGRENEPCPACGAAVRRVTSGQRSAWFCPHCQPLG